VKKKKKGKGVARTNINKYIKFVIKALVVNKLIIACGRI